MNTPGSEDVGRGAGGEIYQMLNDGSFVYLGYEHENRVYKLDGTTGRRLQEIVPADGEDFRYPTGLAHLGDHLYLCDSWHHRLLVFDEAGRQVSALGEFGSDENSFDSPAGLLVVAQEELWVADMGNDRVKVYDKDLNLRRIIPGEAFQADDGCGLEQRMAGRVCTDQPFFPNRLAGEGSLIAVQGNQWLSLWQNERVVTAWKSLEWASFKLIALIEEKPLLLHQQGELFLMDPDHPDPRRILVGYRVAAACRRGDTLMVLDDRGLHGLPITSLISQPSNPFAVVTWRSAEREAPVSHQALLEQMKINESTMLRTIPDLEALPLEQIHLGDVPFASMVGEQVLLDYAVRDEVQARHYRWCHHFYRELDRQAALIAALEDLVEKQGAPGAAELGDWLDSLLALGRRILDHRGKILARPCDEGDLLQLGRRDWVIHHHRCLLLFSTHCLNRVLVPHAEELQRSGVVTHFSPGRFRPSSPYRLEAWIYRTMPPAADGTSLPWQSRTDTLLKMSQLICDYHARGLFSRDENRRYLALEARELLLRLSFTGPRAPYTHFEDQVGVALTTSFLTGEFDQGRALIGKILEDPVLQPIFAASLEPFLVDLGEAPDQTGVISAYSRHSLAPRSVTRPGHESAGTWRPDRTANCDGTRGSCLDPPFAGGRRAGSREPGQARCRQARGIRAPAARDVFPGHGTSPPGTGVFRSG